MQRVSSARVRVDGRIVGEIGPGFLVLLGVSRDDGPGDAEYMAGKIRDLRVFEDEDGKMNRSLVDVGGAALVVSQFTLYGDCRKGRRPSFDAAAPAAVAKAVYEDVVRRLGESGVPVVTGAFQALMQVEVVNDGPVTILLDSRKQF